MEFAQIHRSRVDDAGNYTDETKYPRCRPRALNSIKVGVLGKMASYLPRRKWTFYLPEM